MGDKSPKNKEKKKQKQIKKQEKKKGKPDTISSVIRSSKTL